MWRTSDVIPVGLVTTPTFCPVSSRVAVRGQPVEAGEEPVPPRAVPLPGHGSRCGGPGSRSGRREGSHRTAGGQQTTSGQAHSATSMIAPTVMVTHASARKPSAERAGRDCCDRSGDNPGQPPSPTTYRLVSLRRGKSADERRDPMSTVQGAGVVVTGAGGGIGAALARRFAAEGARVVVNDLDAARPRRSPTEIGGTAVAGDASRIVDAARDALDGTVDIYCANAGLCLARRRLRRRGGLGGGLGRQCDGPRPRGPGAAAGLAGARQRPVRLHRVRRRSADDDRRGAVQRHQARRRSPSPNGSR